MKNFVKISMMLLVSQMAMGVHDVTRIEKQVGNLKVISEHLEQKNPNRHNKIQKFMLSYLAANKIVDTNTPGTLYILQHDANDLYMRFPLDAHSHARFMGGAFIKNSKKAINAKSTFAISYNVPHKTSSTEPEPTALTMTPKMISSIQKHQAQFNNQENA